MDIRVALPTDFNELVRMEKEIFADHAWSKATFVADIEAVHTTYLVAFENNQLVGYAGLASPAGSFQADVNTIAVAENFRRKGLASELLNRLVELATKAGAEQMFLDVRADNHGAIDLYKKFGFTNVEGLLKNWANDHAKNWDANNLLSKLKTWQLNDISKNPIYKGDYIKALKSIRAKTILMPCNQDLYFRTEENEFEKRFIKKLY